MPSQMLVRYKMFRGTLKSWDALFTEASEFASQLPRERMISVSHSADQGHGVVTVWYWADAKDPTD